MLGTISNNIVNVPLRQIIADFGAPVTQGVLVASASVLVLAVAMPSRAGSATASAVGARS